MSKPLHRTRSRLAIAALTAVLFAAGCPDNTPTPSARHWQVVARDLPEAVLSVAGTSATNVWAVGADLGAGPLVLHFDGARWTRVVTGTHGSLWWIRVFDDGTMYLGGEQSTVLRSTDGVTFTRMQTPGLASYTIFGVWGATARDAYAVGSVSGRNGFVWHYDGTTWSDVDLPTAIPTNAGDRPGFFKVWGDAAGHVYVVGGNGVFLLGDRTNRFTVVPTPTHGSLFTVHGTSDRAVIVGGPGGGVILDAPIGRAVTDVTPDGAPLVQGLALEANGHGWASGYHGALFERSNGTWSEVDPHLTLPSFESLHSVWIDPSGGVWSVGGNVLSTQLDHGAILHQGVSDVPAFAPSTPTTDAGADAGDAAVVAATCPTGQVDPAPSGSIARRWNEQNIWAVRRDIPRPGVHARNLFHVSSAMWDAWSSYDATADGVFFTERHTATDVEAARREAMSYAAYDLLVHRYAHATGGAVSAACFRAFMTQLGFDPNDTTTTGDTPRAVGHRVAQAVIAATMADGANEAADYADTTSYASVNPPLIVDQPGVTLPDPNHWQELNLAVAETQNGIITPSGVQRYIGSNWGLVTPFAMTRPSSGALYHDGGAPPTWDQPEMQAWIIDLMRHGAALDHTDGQTVDISPGAYGNNPLGTNDGTGRPMNPATGAPYAPQVVPRGDFARVMSEFWADGPKSETPPGHWFVLANGVADSAGFTRQLGGTGPSLDPLAWDVHVYLAVGGAVHDAAITAWEIKRRFTALRPISTVRYRAQLGQSTEPTSPDYNAHGLPLVPGLIERITAESSAAGQRHAALRTYLEQIAVRSWRGEPGDRAHEVGGVGWIRAVEWIPYQRRTFVTPAFPGFTSGHSTFSRAAAEVLANLTGSPFFPGGLGEFVAHANAYLVFEQGPSVDVHLQWATYFDAADAAGQSRIYGGIHIVPDDFVGRRLGSQVGIAAAARARTYFDGTARP